MVGMKWDEFLLRAKAIWGDRYDYSFEPSGDFKYKKSSLIVKCSHCSDQSDYVTSLYPPSHLRNDKHKSPSGCEECLRIQKNLIAWKEFLFDGKKIWNGKYSYEIKNPKEFNKNNSEVKIICNDDRHPPNFPTLIIASSHLRKKVKSSGCRECLRIDRNLKSWDKFLVDAKEIWGDKYQYKYENPKDFDRKKGWVTIICDDERHHSTEFTDVHPCNHVTKNKHRNPSGCRECFLIEDSKQKQKPFAQFLKDAKVIHGEKYDYIEKTYDGAKANMSIICTIHKKVFSQCPDSHINRAKGCPDCSKNKTLAASRDWRLRKTKERLYERSDGNVVLIEDSFVTWHSESDFVCSEHGEFRDYTSNVLTRGYPCQECNENRVPLQLTEEDILDRFKEKTGNFEILQIEGVGGAAELTIRCHDCSREDFTVKMSNTYCNDYACGACSRQKSEDYRKSRVKEFHKNSKDVRFKSWLERSMEFHNDKYDYSLVKYIDQHHKVEIICPSHHIFWQKPDNHLNKECRKCADEKLNGLYTKTFFERFPQKKAVPAILYYIKIKHKKHIFYKVGITKNSIKIRYGKVAASAFNITPLAIWDTTLYEAFVAEQALLSGLSSPDLLLDNESFVRELRDSTIGTTEIFCDSLSDSDITKYFKQSTA